MTDGVSNLTQQLAGHLDDFEKVEMGVEFGGMGLVTIGLIGGNAYQGKHLGDQAKAFQKIGSQLSDKTSAADKTAVVMKFLNEDKATKNLERVKTFKTVLRSLKHILQGAAIAMCSVQIHSKKKSQAEILELYTNTTDELDDINQNLTNISLEIESMLTNMTMEVKELLLKVKNQNEQIFITAGRSLCTDQDFYNFTQCDKFDETECSISVSTDVGDIKGLLKDIGELTKAFQTSYTNFDQAVDLWKKRKQQMEEAKNTKIVHYQGRHPSVDVHELCHWLQEDYPERWSRQSGKYYLVYVLLLFQQRQHLRYDIRVWYVPKSGRLANSVQWRL